jgi:predicted small lipoprotein YifL
MSPGLPFARTMVLVGLVALSVAACGRRGALEPPPGSNPNALGETVTDESTTLAAPIGTPAQNRREPITVPKQPFILDPLL